MEGRIAGGGPVWGPGPGVLLGEHRASRARVARLGRRSLGPGLRALIWGLRLYVLMMVVLTLLSVWRAP